MNLERIDNHTLFIVATLVVIIGSMLLSIYSSSTVLQDSSSTTKTQTVSVYTSHPPSSKSSYENSTNVTSTSSSSTKTVPMSSTGVIVPIFSSYSKLELNDVNQVIAAKLTYPSVPIIAVLNPAGGPGGAYNQNYTSEVKQMQLANITVLGYVPTTWGTRPIANVESDISKFREWYNVNGIYLDQMPNWEKDGPQGQWYYNGTGGTYLPSYFSNITSYVKSLGMTEDFGNSGADIPQNLLGTVSIVGIFENGFIPAYFGWPSLTGISAWHLSRDKTNFAFFAYNVPSLNQYYVVGASDYVSYLYLTNGKLNAPYASVSSYLDGLVSTLASMVPVRIVSESLNGSAVYGVNCSLTQPDGISSSGFAPFNFNALRGSTVTISAGNYSGHSFEHWSDGSTKQNMNLTVSQAVTLVAYYS